MTQDKMRRLITACVSAATVLLVFLLGFLIYQWISIANLDKRIEAYDKEIAALEEQRAQLDDDENYYLSNFYIQQRIDEINQKKDLLQGK